MDDREFFCGAMNVSEGSLEGAFVDDLAQLADAGLHAVVKDRILHVWEQRRAEANERTTEPSFFC